MVEVTVNSNIGTVSSDVVLENLALRECTTLIRTLYWVVATHRPVIVDDIFIVRLIAVTILTAEWTFGTEVSLMDINVATCDQLRAVDALNLTVPTPF